MKHKLDWNKVDLFSMSLMISGWTSLWIKLIAVYGLKCKKKRFSCRSPVYPGLHRHSPVDGTQEALLWHWHSSEQCCPNLPSGHGWPQTAPCASNQQKEHTRSVNHVRDFYILNLCIYVSEPTSSVCSLSWNWLVHYQVTLPNISPNW